MPWIYGVKIDEDEAGDQVVAVRDLPEVQTSGDTRGEALALAADAMRICRRALRSYHLVGRW